MGMTGAGLSAARLAAIAAVTPVQTSSPTAAAAYQQAVILADSGAIVSYIQANMIVDSSGSDPQGGTVTSVSTTVS
jgi:hypothetical protein